MNLVKQQKRCINLETQDPYSESVEGVAQNPGVHRKKITFERGRKARVVVSFKSVGGGETGGIEKNRTTISARKIDTGKRSVWAIRGTAQPERSS